MNSKRRRSRGNPAKAAQPRSARGQATAKPAPKSPGSGFGLGFGSLGGVEVSPPSGALYPQLLRRPAEVWWQSAFRAMIGILAALSLYFLLVSVVSQGLVMLSWTITSPALSYSDYYSEAMAFRLPAGMLATNLGIATLIPVSFAVIMVVHQVRPRWLGSVRPRLRWSYLFVSLGIAAVSLAAVFALSTLVGPAFQLKPQPGFWTFMIIIAITSPLQAAGEEFLFRGYLLQAFGSMVKNPWFGVLLSSLVFAAFHGLQNPPLFLNRLAFGILAAILVMKTGGVEAGIGAHVINNVYAFGLAGLTSSVAQSRALTSIGWVDAAFDVGGFALFAVLAYLASRLMKLRTKTV